MYDIIIVGAGVAGLTLAGKLKSSLKVLLLDSFKEPHKHISCAEWTKDFGILKKYILQKTTGMTTKYCGITNENSNPGLIINRVKWQQDMLHSLKDVDVHLGETVKDVKTGIVKTNKGTYKSEIIVGADGTLSVVRKSFGYSVKETLPATNVSMKLVKPMNKTLVHFLPEIVKGYGWCFPKGEFANVGVGATEKLHVTLQFYVKFLVEKKIVEPGFENIFAGLLPLYEMITNINDKVFLTGDCAGLTDPLTGAGIYQAWDSAMELGVIINEGSSGEIYKKNIFDFYSGFRGRRLTRRKIFEENWGDLGTAVSESWILGKNRKKK